jgi:ribosomal-protein-alanine N-acetyltransferase
VTTDGGVDSTVCLRPLRRGDLDQVDRLERELFGAGAWSRNVYESEFAEPGRRYVAAVDARGALVGYAGVSLGEDCEVMTIGVASGWRRCGIGTRLLDALLGAARTSRARRVFLEVRTSDEGAQRLYERAGFRPIGIRRGYYQPGNADALVMRLDLARARPVGAEAMASTPTEEDL